MREWTGKEIQKEFPALARVFEAMFLEAWFGGSLETLRAWEEEEILKQLDVQANRLTSFEERLFFVGPNNPIEQLVAQKDLFRLNDWLDWATENQSVLRY